MTALLDHAFGLAKDAHEADGHARAKHYLQSQHPGIGWDDIVKAYLRACDLAEACYDYGERLRTEKMSEPQAMGEMEERFPGFSSDTYRSALSHGYFISR